MFQIRKFASKYFLKKTYEKFLSYNNNNLVTVQIPPIFGQNLKTE